MQLRADELERHLSRSLAPLYIIHGDEPLQSLEAADAIRAAARVQGYAEREVLAVERGFDWKQLLVSGASLSLFSSKKLIELRIPGGKPGTDGAAAIVQHCSALAPEVLTIVTLPKLDRRAQDTAWFKALAHNGVLINTFQVERAQLPQWIAARLARQKQKAGRETLQFLADSVEGNLLAAHQEIQKLGLLFPPGELAFDPVCGAVLNVARYDAFKLNEAMLSGDRARLARMLDGLKSEGEAPPKILWVLAEEIRAVAKVQAGMALGEDLQQLYRNNRVWGGVRQQLVTVAARRLKSAALAQALSHAARIDRTVKGLIRGDVWDELLQLCLRFAR
ncbi:MAG: DNA polymerase III subunit delta [Betaproteobacteria bacterium]|nr:MAG: DNA polymerase III subunit delta [Betaproteobacteria bacterium]